MSIDYQKASYAEAMRRATEALGRGDHATAKRLLDEALDTDERGVHQPQAKDRPGWSPTGRVPA